MRSKVYIVQCVILSLMVLVVAVFSFYFNFVINRERCDALSDQLDQQTRISGENKKIILKEFIISPTSTIVKNSFSIETNDLMFSIPVLNPTQTDPLESGRNSVFSWGEKDNLHRIIIMEPRDFRTLVDGHIEIVGDEVSDKRQCIKTWEGLSGISQKATDKDLFFQLANFSFGNELSPLSLYALSTIRVLILGGREVLVAENNGLTLVDLMSTESGGGLVYVFDTDGKQILTLFYSGTVTQKEKEHVLSSIKLK